VDLFANKSVYKTIEVYNILCIFKWFYYN
jgi:hypothetical protein